MTGQLKKDDLLELASRMDIAGRHSMSKDELAAAIDREERKLRRKADDRTVHDPGAPHGG